MISNKKQLSHSDLIAMWEQMESRQKDYEAVFQRERNAWIKYVLARTQNILDNSYLFAMEITQDFKTNVAQELERCFTGIDPDHKPDGTAAYNITVNKAKDAARAVLTPMIDLYAQHNTPEWKVYHDYMNAAIADKGFSMYPIVVTKNPRLKGMRPVDQRRK